MVRSLTKFKLPEPDLLQASREKRRQRAAEALPEELKRRDIRTWVHGIPESELLLLDAQTTKDLEIFSSEAEGRCLFDFCNYTRNGKGAKVLQARMQRPFANPALIRDTQQSVGFILEHRTVFDELPTFAITDLVENYIFGILPLIVSTNAFEFMCGVVDIRFGDDLRYSRIMHGVEATSDLVRALRRIVHHPALLDPRGEIAGMLDEIRELLAHPGFALVTDLSVWKMRPWRILRIDQVFRLEEKSNVYRLLHLTYELDALLSMAEATQRHNLVMPEIMDGPLSVRAEELIHPLVDKAVANPLALDQQRRLLFLTGPNMAGKTTYLRAGAIALYLGHLGMGVPAKSFRFTPAQRLFSSISLADNFHIGVSYFRAEALRVKAIAEAVSAGYRVVAIMDEPFKGTNVKDAHDASLAILLRLTRRNDCLFMFSSHLIELGENIGDETQVDCRHFRATENAGKLQFDYVLRPGVSTQRLGMRVLEEEGIFELLDGKPA